METYKNMICPHCGTPIQDISEGKQKEILNIIKKEIHTTASLCKKFHMSRGTMVYYLNKLRLNNKIIFEELTHVTGKPKIIRYKGVKNI